MFGRPTRTAVPPGDPAGHVPRGFTAETVLVALPDTRAINYVGALGTVLGRGLAGHAGTPYGYDGGDPMVTLTGPVPGRPTPTAAYAKIAGPNPAKPIPQYSDLALTDPALDPYMALLWQRMQTR